VATSAPRSRRRSGGYEEGESVAVRRPRQISERAVSVSRSV
jgi:hypothetical protein